MKILVTLCVACALAVGLSVVASAHVGPTFYAQQVSPSSITLDGQGTDAGWNAPAWLPENTITRDMLGGNVTGGELPSVDDWDGILKVGWSAPPDNMLYIYSQVKDDIFRDDITRNGDAWNGNDTLEIITDADHGGGDYGATPPRGTIGQQFGWRAVPGLSPGPANDEGNTRTFLWGAAERAWMSGPPWMEMAQANPVGTTNVTYAYEGKMALWDLSGDTPEASQRHINAEGQTIGLTFQWDDGDESPTRESQPGTQGSEGGASWTDASVISDFVLIPGGTAVEATSWGAIKATFQR